MTDKKYRLVEKIDEIKKSQNKLQYSISAMSERQDEKFKMALSNGKHDNYQQKLVTEIYAKEYNKIKLKNEKKRKQAALDKRNRDNQAIQDQTEAAAKVQTKVQFEQK